MINGLIISLIGFVLFFIGLYVYNKQNSREKWNRLHKQRHKQRLFFESRRYFGMTLVELISLITAISGLITAIAGLIIAIKS